MKSKITIMKKPEISDEEIRAYMDFDRLLMKHQNVKAANTHLLKILGFGSVVIIVGALVGLWFYDGTNKGNTGKASSQELVFTDSVTHEPSKPVTENRPETRSEQADREPTSVTPPRTLTPAQKQIKEPPSVVERTKDSVVVAQPVYVQAEPVDGYPSLYSYFSSELKYPEAMMKDSVQGVVMVVFTINSKGEPEKINIDQSLGKAFDDEAVRLIQSMPAWRPATYNKKPVPSRISLPITFQIRKLKSEQ